MSKKTNLSKAIVMSILLGASVTVGGRVLLLKNRRISF